MKNQPVTLKHNRNRTRTMKNQMQPWKPTWSCTGYLWVVTGGYRRLQRGSDDFSLHTNTHCIIIYISSPSSSSSKFSSAVTQLLHISSQLWSIIISIHWFFSSSNLYHCLVMGRTRVENYWTTVLYINQTCFLGKNPKWGGMGPKF